MKLITLQNFNIQTCFSQFLWVLQLRMLILGQMISRIHLSLPNAAYKRVLIEMSMEIGMLNFGT